MALPSGAYFASQFIRRREEWLKILETYFWPQDRKLKKGFTGNGLSDFEELSSAHKMVRPKEQIF